ncbi:MAG: general secretion pathway protein K [Lysobacterales bacterium]|jgi:general secretion pathway protein K
MKIILKNNKGSILVFTLWVVSLLTIFAVQIGLTIRQRTTLLSRIETRSTLRHIAEAGIKKSLSALKLDLERNNQIYTAFGKYYRHNNPQKFNNIFVGNGVSQVQYNKFDTIGADPILRYGFVDEERKLNINLADHVELERLIENTTQIAHDEARDIANAIISWREIGDTELAGFYSDDYYSQLEYPYEVKGAPFETISELRLLRSVTEIIYETLKPFITTYGSGRVNINTVSPQVLNALGVSTTLIDKILIVRKGLDGIDDTADDYMFYKTFDIAAEIINFMELEISEIQQIDYLNTAGKITTNSFYYFIESVATLGLKKEVFTAECVYNLNENKIEYWQEK